MSVPPRGYPPPEDSPPGGGQEVPSARSKGDEDTIITGPTTHTGWPDPQSYPPAQQPEAGYPPTAGPQQWVPFPSVPPAEGPAGRGRGRWWLIGGVVAMVVASAAAGLGFVVGRHHESAPPAAASSSSVPPAPGGSTSVTTPTSAAPSSPTAAPSTTPGGGPNLPADALPGLLPDAQTVGSLLGVDGLTVSKDASGPSNGTATPPECLSALAPVEEPAYAGSGFVAIRKQQLRQAGEQFQNDVAQAVVSFNSAADATTLVDNESRRWSTCADKTVTGSLGGGPTQTWQVASTSNIGGVLSVSTTVPISGVGTWTCQRALTAQRNVVVDVRVCSASGGQASALANQIAKRISGS